MRKARYHAHSRHSPHRSFSHPLNLKALPLAGHWVLPGDDCHGPRSRRTVLVLGTGYCGACRGSPSSMPYGGLMAHVLVVITR